MEGSVKKKEPHYHGHRERLRARFLSNPQSVPDYELLELILYWVYPRRDVKPEAKRLLDHYSSLKQLMHETFLTPSLTFTFQLIRETSRRLLLEEIRSGPLLNNTQRVIDYCRLTMGHLPAEQFRLFFLDRKYYLIQEMLHQSGTLDQVPLYPREVLKKALECNAANLIMVHNHPSGETTPSSADIEMTKHLKAVLMPFSIRVLDHFIVGKFSHFSFREQGLLG